MCNIAIYYFIQLVPILLFQCKIRVQPRVINRVPDEQREHNGDHINGWQGVSGGENRTDERSQSENEGYRIKIGSAN